VRLSACFGCAGTISIQLQLFEYVIWNWHSLPSWNGSMYCTDSDAMMAQKKARHMVLCGKKDETSSSEYRIPPIGAPNATATPAAQAADRISLVLACEWRYRANSAHCRFPMAAAMCTKGPSLPTLSPELTDSTSATHLTSRVHPPSTLRTTTPPRIVLISGMPLPAA